MHRAKDSIGGVFGPTKSIPTGKWTDVGEWCRGDHEEPVSDDRDILLPTAAAVALRPRPGSSQADSCRPHPVALVGDMRSLLLAGKKAVVGMVAVLTCGLERHNFGKGKEFYLTSLMLAIGCWKECSIIIIHC